MITIILIVTIIVIIILNQSAYITEVVFRIERPCVTENGLNTIYRLKMEECKYLKVSSANFLLQRPKHISITQSFPRYMQTLSDLNAFTP